MGDLSVWNTSSKTLQYVVDGDDEKRRGMFNDGGAVVALSQTRHYVAVAFRWRFWKKLILGFNNF